MYKLSVISLILLSLFTNAGEFKNKKIYTYGKIVELIGTKKAIKNMPFLFLNEPIEVKPQIPDNSDGIDVPEQNIKNLQIAMSSKINKIPNGCVILKGDLYHGFNAHHYTKVLIHTTSYRKCNK